jgi:competence protein ComEA
VEAQYQAAASAVAPVNGGKVDINTAPAAELAELPGIGEVLAQRIVEYREENGPFASIEDIQGVSGIGAGKFADMEAEITVGTAEGDG